MKPTDQVPKSEVLALLREECAAWKEEATRWADGSSGRRWADSVVKALEKLIRRVGRMEK